MTMNRGVTYDSRHSYWDWGLLMKSCTVSPPKPKTNIVEVPGTDQVIDLSEVLTGEIHYKQREIKCEYIMMCDRSKWPALYTDILNHLHGKLMQIILDEDKEYYYTGRAEVSKWKLERGAAEITITAQVEPYKTARYIPGKQVL